MSKEDETLRLLMEINSKVSHVDTTVQLQAKDIQAIKDEQIRQNKVVEEHERRSTASENRLGIIEDQHNTFKVEHETFKERITVAEQPSKVLQGVWKGLLILGTGAGACLGILKFFDYLK